MNNFNEKKDLGANFGLKNLSQKNTAQCYDPFS